MSNRSHKIFKRERNEIKKIDIESTKEEQYKMLFDDMTEMIEIIELIYNKSAQPIDFYIRDINTSFAKFLNKPKEQLIHKKMSSISSHLEDNLLTSFARVDKTGKSTSFKNYAAKNDKHYFVTVWKVSKNKMGVSFSDISHNESNKIELKRSLKKEKKIREEAESVLLKKRIELNKTNNELALTNMELAFQNKEKEKRVNELGLANIKLAIQNKEKGKLAEELRQFIDTANTPIFGIDNKGLVNEWNQCAERITGYKKDDILGENLIKSYAAKTYKRRIKEAFYLALKGKETTNFELPLFTKDGQRVKILLNLTTRKNTNGEITGVMGVGQNITKIDTLRTKTEAIAKELRQFIETANTPIFGIDSSGLINEWNETAEKITGYKKHEVLGLNWIKFTPGKSLEKAKKVVTDALKGEQTSNFEFLTYTKDRKEVILLVNTSTRRSASGKITGVLGVGQDITKLVSYRNELESKVNERTLKLNEALKKEKELSEIKSKFVSTASHEFRTPLSAINFAAGSIKKYWSRMEPIKVSEKLTKIEDQVEHMTELLDDILIVGQATAGEIRNKPSNLNIGNFIEEIIEEIYNSCKKSHEILLIDNESLKKTTFFIDEKLGRNIFINLIGNAVKFSPNAKKIIIELSSEKDNIIFSVTDFGIGIPSSEFQNIFTPFTRGENVDLIQGTGLGLTIVKEAIDILGGDITVKSNIEKGTSFIVRIPKINK